MDAADGRSHGAASLLETISPIRGAKLVREPQDPQDLGLNGRRKRFIKAGDGHFYFLEVAARVGGAFIAELQEAASGVNLWREWAKMELAGGTRPAEERPTARRDYGGIALSLARQEWPDTSKYDDPEIVFRVRKAHHVGLVVSSPSLARVRELLGQYTERFADDFAAVVPPLERVPQ